jgi:hypothetical protein
MAGPVAEPKPTIRENVQEVETGQVRVGGIARRSVVRIGESYTTPTGQTKWWVQNASDGEGGARFGWGPAIRMHAKTIVARWPDVEE